MDTTSKRARQAQDRATHARHLRAATLPPESTPAERCPDCHRGVVLPTKHVGNPEAIQYVCSRYCGWDA